MNQSIEQNGKKRWFTPEITTMMDNIMKEKWFVREVIYHKK